MLCGVILGSLKYFIGVVLFCVLVNTYLVCFDLILILVHCKFVLSCRVRKTAGSDRYANFSSFFLLAVRRGHLRDKRYRNLSFGPCMPLYLPLLPIVLYTGPF